MSSAPDSSTSFIVDRGYECRTSRCDDPLPLGLEWSILTPNPSYTTHAPETFKENRLFLYTTVTGAAPRTIRAPLTTTFPAENSVKRIFYDRFDHTYPEMNLHDSYNETTDIGTTFLGPHVHGPDDLFHLEYSFPINSAGYAKGTLFGGQEIDCMIDTGALRSIMSRGFFEACPVLATLP